MSDLSAGVAATVGLAATQAEGRAVSLHVADALAVVALLGCMNVNLMLIGCLKLIMQRTIGSARMRAVIGLVSCETCQSPSQRRRYTVTFNEPGCLQL